MAEKVNKSDTSYHYHSIINMCVFYLSCHLAQRRAETLQFTILSRNMRFISWIRSQIRYSSNSMTDDMCFRAKTEWKMHVWAQFLLYCHIFMNKHSRNTMSDRQFVFFRYRSKCFIEEFLLQRTGSIF